MRVRILTAALNDLANGREFYEKQAEGVGSYFFDSLFSDIDSLAFTVEFTPKCLDSIACSRVVFLMQFITRGGARDEVVVYRVLDCRQDPAKTATALKIV